MLLLLLRDRAPPIQGYIIAMPKQRVPLCDAQKIPVAPTTPVLPLLLCDRALPIQGYAP